MEYYSAIKENEVLIHANTWMNLENMVSERSHTQKFIYYVISYLQYVQNRHIHRKRK